MEHKAKPEEMSLYFLANWKEPPGKVMYHVDNMVAKGDYQELSALRSQIYEIKTYPVADNIQVDTHGQSPWHSALRVIRYTCATY